MLLMQRRHAVAWPGTRSLQHFHRSRGHCQTAAPSAEQLDLSRAHVGHCSRRFCSSSESAAAVWFELHRSRSSDATSALRQGTTTTPPPAPWHSDRQRASQQSQVIADEADARRTMLKPRLGDHRDRLSPGPRPVSQSLQGRYLSQGLSSSQHSCFSRPQAGGAGALPANTPRVRTHLRYGVPRLN